MMAHQLDLFGGPLKPPKKIKVDDDEIPVEDPKPAPTPAPVTEPEPEVEINAEAETEKDPWDLALEETTADDGNAWAADDNVAEIAEEPVEEEEDWRVAYLAEQDALRTPGNTPLSDAPLLPGEVENETEEEIAFTDEAIFEATPEKTAGENEEPTAIVAEQWPVKEVEEQQDASIETEITVEAAMDDELSLPAINDESEIAADDTDETISGDALTIQDDEVESDITSEVETSKTEELGAAIEIAEEPGVEEDELEEIVSNAEPVALTTLPKARKISADSEDGLNIPPDEELFKRQYYSMRETSAMFGVNQSLLRFWENEFEILQPKKNKKGDRYFRPVDIKNLVLIHNLLRVRKFTLEGAKDYLNKNKKAADSFELVRRLEKLKSFLLELKAGL